MARPSVSAADWGNPAVALAYALVAAVFFALAKLGTSSLSFRNRNAPCHPQNEYFSDRGGA
jgi:hypothetical protein